MTFLFDNNLPSKIAKGLKEFGEQTSHLMDHLPADTIDIKIFEFLFKNDMILITKDKNMRYNDAERTAINQYKVGVFFLGGKNLSAWEIIEQVIRNWRKIKETAERENRPFAYTVRSSGTTLVRANI